MLSPAPYGQPIEPEPRERRRRQNAAAAGGPVRAGENVLISSATAGPAAFGGSLAPSPTRPVKAEPRERRR